MTLAVHYEDVVAAAERLAGHAHRTPVLTSRTADALAGAQLFFKCENLQRMGAFKFRGAFNAIAKLDAQQRKRGVLAFSSGNHAQAIALAAREQNVKATILMPGDAPSVKIAATRGYGAEVVTYDRMKQDREALARDLAAQRGAVLIPPYDHADVIAGQGTAALELFDEVGTLDALLVCVGGGGLISGCATVAAACAPDCRVIGVEPEAGNDIQQSLAKGEIVTIAVPVTLADGAQTTHAGQLTFPIIQQKVAEIVTVSDAQLVETMRFFAQTMKLVVEPTGCLAAAAALHKVVGFARQGAVPGSAAGARVGVIISGGNVDLVRYAGLLAGSAA